MTAGSQIAGRTLSEWQEFARRDDCLDRMVPSDLRALVGRLAPTIAAKPPASGVDAVAVRAVLEEAKFALFCSDMTIKDRADQSLRLMLASLSPAATSGSEAGGEAEADRILKDALFALLKTGRETSGYSGVLVDGGRYASIYFAKHNPGEIISVARVPENLAKPASSPAGGDVREIDEISEAIGKTGMIVRGDGSHTVIPIAVVARLLDLARAALSPSASAAEPVAWRMGEPVNPKNLGDMTWLPYEEGLRYLCVNTFLGRWREYDERGLERPDRDRIAFCCQDEHGDLLALGSDGGELSSPTWRIVDEPDEILVSYPPAPAAVDGQRVKALVWNEYETEGVVDRWDAETALGTFYEISTQFDGYHVAHDCTHLAARIDTLEEAKAAAQADYEARIRACLATDKEGA